MKLVLTESFQIPPTDRSCDEEAMIFQTPPQRLKQSALSVERQKCTQLTLLLISELMEFFNHNILRAFMCNKVRVVSTGTGRLTTGLSSNDQVIKTNWLLN